MPIELLFLFVPLSLVGLWTLINLWRHRKYVIAWWKAMDENGKINTDHQRWNANTKEWENYD